MKSTLMAENEGGTLSTAPITKLAEPLGDHAAIDAQVKFAFFTEVQAEERHIERRGIGAFQPPSYRLFDAHSS